MSENMGRFTMFVLVVALLVLVLSNLYRLSAASPVQLSVTPMVCQPPCTLRMVVRIEKHPDNRWLVLSWCDVVDFAGTCGSSTMQLEGETMVDRSDLAKDLPKGVYNVSAQLFRKNYENRVGNDEKVVYVGVNPADYLP